MKLSQMFPSKYLASTDLPPGQFVTVTIEAVDWSEFKGDHDEQEIAYLLKLREFKKPMKLNKTNAQLVAQVLKTDETDEWIGRQIRVFPTTATFAGQSYAVIRVDMNPVHGVGLPPRSSPSGAPIVASQPSLPASGGLPAGFDARPIGQKRSEDLTRALAECGATYSEFLAWLRTRSEPVWERCSGVALDELPLGLKPFKDEFLAKAAASKPGDAAPDVDIPF